MYNQPHTMHLRVITLKQMYNCSKDYICMFIAFMFRKTFTLILAIPKWTEMLH